MALNEKKNKYFFSVGKLMKLQWHDVIFLFNRKSETASFILFSNEESVMQQVKDFSWAIERIFVAFYDF